MLLMCYMLSSCIANLLICICCCSTGMHQDCFNVYLLSQITKAGEQNDMVLDKTRLQFCCPLCKKLGNVFLPHVETDPARMEAREAARQKLVQALKRRQAQQQDASDAAAADESNPDVRMVHSAATPVPDTVVVVRPDTTALPVPAVSLLPGPLERAAQQLRVSTDSAECQQVWSLAGWLHHPSLTNSDLGAFTRSVHPAISQHQVSFMTTLNDDNSGNMLKRARSRTNDSTDYGRVSSKLNTGAETPDFPSPTAEALAYRGGSSPMQTQDAEADETGEMDAHGAYAMGFALNDIDLNSTSTERAAAASEALDEDLRGISLDAASGSMDEYDADEEFSSLLDFAYPTTDPGRDLERAQRRVERVVETLYRHGREDYVPDYVRRSTWSKYVCALVDLPVLFLSVASIIAVPCTTSVDDEYCPSIVA
jgi:hypothetical protein